MRRTTTPLRMALALSILAALACGALAQGGSGLPPGATGVRKQDGGAATSCTARNALATKQCTTTCPAGQNADCEDADGGGDPTCSCSGG